LIVNTFYYPRGGAPVYGLNLASMLRQQGHNVIPFSMKSPHNLQSPYEDYFVDYIDFREELSGGIKNSMKVLRRIFYFKQARENIEKLLSQHKIDIVHLNNFLHHIGLSIIQPIKERNIPIVWSLHDHILVCPNTNLFDDKRKCACDICSSNFRRYILPWIRRCKKNSFGASLLASMEALYNSLFRVSGIPEKFIAPSNFLMEQHKKMGFDISNFEVVPNFVEIEHFQPHYEPGDYLFYFGRLSAEKGVENLIRAANMIKIPLVIAGSGPQQEELKKLSQDLQSDTKFLGFIQGEKLREAIYNSRIVVLPSVCYENAPLMILETYASGKPVVGSDIGGITEMIPPEVGKLFPSGDIDAMANKIISLWNDKSQIVQMSKCGRKLVEQKYSSKIHLQNIMRIYNEII